MKRAKQTFRFGEHSFTTKKAATEAIRKVLYAYNPGESLKEEDASFMANVLEHHPEAAMKIGCGVRSFQVENNHPTRGFWITRTDGTRTDFSFLSCLTPPTPEMDARKAFRTEVRDQLVAFKANAFSSSAQLACAVTGVLLTSDRCHVDHYEPTFLELTEQFLASRGVAIVDVQVEPTLDGSTETKLLDRELAKAWAEFHTRAKLRIVSAHANLSLLRRGP